jgi:hypothetical protein
MMSLRKNGDSGNFAVIPDSLTPALGEIRTFPQLRIVSGLPVTRPQPGSFDPFAAVNECIGDFPLFEKVDMLQEAT